MRRVALLLLCLTALCISMQADAASVAVFSGQATFATAVSGRIASLGFDTSVWTDVSTVTPENLDSVDALIVLTGSAFLLEQQRDVISNYVANGGALIVEQPNVAQAVPILPPGLEIYVSDRMYSDMGVSLTPEGLIHPMTADLFAADIPGNMDTVYAADVSPAYTILAAGASNPDLVALAVASYGRGKVVFHTGNTHPYSVRPGSDEFIRRMVGWATTPEPPSELMVRISTAPAKINLKSRGYVHVNLLSDQDFDALNTDPASVRVAGAVPERWAAEDVDLDGRADMVFSVSIPSLGLDPAVTEIELTGRTSDGMSIRGTGAVAVMPSKK